MSVDQRVLTWVLAHRSDAATTFFRTVTALGALEVVVVVLLVATVALLWRRRIDLAVVLVASSACTWLVVNVAKLLVRRPRPPEVVRLVHAGGWSFPSGHAGQAAATYLALGVVAALLLPRRWQQALAVTCGAALGVLVGASRIYLGVHWLTDVLAGWVVGGAVFAALLFVTLHSRPGRCRCPTDP